MLIMENNKIFRVCLFVLGAVLLAGVSGCVSPPSEVNSLTAENHDYLQSESERKLIKISEGAHAELEEKGLLYRDQELNTYINDIGKALLPDSVENILAFNFYVLKDPSINAYAMPNGNIYFNVGLLSKVENEAQLANVVAHEIAHVVQRHSYKRKLNRHNTIVAAHITDLFLFGTGLAYLPAASSLASHSREHEKESDLFAVDYLAENDYNMEEGLKVFGKLVEQKYEYTSGSVWASHPDSGKRKQYVAEAIHTKYQGKVGSKVNSDQYKVFRDKVAELNVRLRLLRRSYELAEDSINLEIVRGGDDHRWQFYLGQVYLKRSQNPKAAAREHAWLYKKTMSDSLTKFEGNGDQYLTKAHQHFTASLAMDESFVLAKKGLGMVYFERGEYAEAETYLKEYLSVTDSPKDQRYVLKVIEKINKRK